MASHQQVSDTEILQAVRNAYSAKAKTGEETAFSNRVASSFGYSLDDLNSAPVGSHMGLSCGNPIATATIAEGEKVLDLGSGGGLDVLLAAKKVGPSGQAIGLDGSQEMLDRARRNASKQGLTPPNVAFAYAELTDSLPIRDTSIDCVLSNCVINLLPQSGKRDVFKEVFRVLKPGGRVCLSDIVAKQLLPEDIRNDLSRHVGCIAGAIQVDSYKKMLSEAGLTDILFVDTKSDLNVYKESESCCSAAVGDDRKSGCCVTNSSTTDGHFNANEWVGSYQIYAVKPHHDLPEGTSIPSALMRWWDAYPAPKSSPGHLTRNEVAMRMRDPQQSVEKDYVVIDVRQSDHAGGHVLGSVQRGAQTFYDNLPTFHERFKDTERVIFYCNSSTGRGPRCAGWYQDYLDDKGEKGSKAFVLEGGINGWKSDPDMQDLVANDSV